MGQPYDGVHFSSIFLLILTVRRLMSFSNSFFLRRLVLAGGSSPLITAVWNLHPFRMGLAMPIMPDDMLTSRITCPQHAGCLLPLPTFPPIHHNKEHQRDSFRLTLGWPMIFDPAGLRTGTIVVP